MKMLKKSLSIAAISLTLMAGTTGFIAVQADMTPEYGGVCPAGEC